jgi:hypothetical protein
MLLSNLLMTLSAHSEPNTPLAFVRTETGRVE